MLDRERLTAFAPTTDAPRARAFYEGTLGLTLRADDGFALSFDANGTELRVTKVAAFTPHPFTVLGWQVTGLDDVMRGLVERGVTFERFPGIEQGALGAWSAPGGTRVAWFRDPDGNLLSVAEYAGG